MNLGRNNLQLNVYCDGGARGNPGPAASAFVVKENTGKILHKQGFYLGIATNNQAEYQAVLEALKFLNTSPLALNTVTFYLDSLLVVNQLNKKFKIKDDILKEKFAEIRNYLEQLGQLEIRIIFNYVPRSYNYQADKIVNETLDNAQGNFRRV